MARRSTPQRHEDTCPVCQGTSRLKPEKPLPGRPRDSWASLGASPIRWKETTK